MESFRKAYGALKDSTKVGLAKVNSEFKDLDIAIVKSTNHVERPPKERHVRTWDCSAWIRTYALYLEERLECFRNLNYDIESDRGTKSASGISKTPVPNAEDLLDRLTALQQLLYRVVCCQPEGAARHNFVVQCALALVVKESFKVYCAINDGIINLVDMFFEMLKHDAVRALEIYKKAGQQADHLADFYDFCRTLDLAQTFQFPTLRQPPPSFLATMEDYIKEAPLSQRRQEYQETKEEPQKIEERAPQENVKQVKEVENKDKIVHSQEETVSKAKEVNPPLISVEEPVDLLGLNEVDPKAGNLQESNTLALAIVQLGNDAPQTNNALDGIENTFGWELPLVTAPSNINKPQEAETKMAGGFDRTLLDSLYEDDMARRQLQLHSAGYSPSYGYGMTAHNIYDQRAPFAMANNIVPPMDAQMAMILHHHHHMTIHQHQMMMQQQNMMMMMMVPQNNPYAAQYHPQQQQMPHVESSNPFDDPFGGYPESAMHPSHGNHTLL